MQSQAQPCGLLKWFIQTPELVNGNESFRQVAKWNLPLVSHKLDQDWPTHSSSGPRTKARGRYLPRLAPQKPAPASPAPAARLPAPGTEKRRVSRDGRIRVTQDGPSLWAHLDLQDVVGRVGVKAAKNAKMLSVRCKRLADGVCVARTVPSSMVSSCLWCRATLMKC